jgi:hypothetical protein
MKETEAYILALLVLLGTLAQKCKTQNKQSKTQNKQSKTKMTFFIIFYTILIHFYPKHN